MNRLVCILLLISLTSFAFAGGAGQGAYVHTLVIDPGHGGMDPGAIGPGKHHESDLALGVSLKFGEMVKKAFPDVKIIYTRTTDKFVSLADRADMANKAKADLFICIHLNAATNHDAYGTATYVLGLHRTDDNLEVAKRENAVIDLESDKDKNYEFDPNSPEGHIIMSMKQNAFLDQSILIASKIEDELAVLSKRKSHGVKQAGFWVLYKTAMPSLLAEIGFISNPTEEQYLSTDDGQTNIATSIFKAFRSYKNQIEGKKELDAATAPPPAAPKAPVTTMETPSTNTTQVTPPAPAVDKDKPVTLNTTEVKKEEKVWQADTTVAATQKKESTTVYTPINQLATLAVDTQPATKGNKVLISPEESSPKIERKPVAIKDVNGKTASTKPKSGSAKPTKTIDETPKARVDTLIPTPVAPPVKVETTDASLAKTIPVAKTLEASKTPVKTTRPAEKTTPKVQPKEEFKSDAIGKDDNVVFTVQLIAMGHKPSNYDNLVTSFGVINREVLSNGLIRYMAGQYTHYSEAKKALSLAHDKGYKDAFIVGYENGKRTDTKRTSQLAAKHP